MNELTLFGDLALDLKRVAVGYWRGSDKMAERFALEAFNHKKELEGYNLRPYLKKLLADIDRMLAQGKPKEVAEDALMYSTLFQNAALKR